MICHETQFHLHLPELGRYYYRTVDHSEIKDIPMAIIKCNKLTAVSMHSPFSPFVLSEKFSSEISCARKCMLKRTETRLYLDSTMEEFTIVFSIKFQIHVQVDCVYFGRVL